MKHVMIAVLSAGLILGSCIEGETVDLKDEKAKLSYSIGYQVGGDFRRQGRDIDPQILLKGVRDGLDGSASLMTQEKMRTTLIELQKEILNTREKKAKTGTAKNPAAGKTFSAEDAGVPGIEK
jgi:FKBP-type peptidyl-prolyl cis-trans isomerase FklB